MKIKYPITVGIACGLLGMAFSLTGYGYLLYYIRLLILDTLIKQAQAFHEKNGQSPEQFCMRSSRDEGATHEYYAILCIHMDIG